MASHAPDIKYDVANFKYDKLNDTFTCPQGEILTTNGRWYQRDNGKSFTQMKHYKTKACYDCPVNNLCTKNNAGRLIERSEHASFIEQNRLNIEANPTAYKKRQAIIEHTYGIIKRQWGFYFISTKKGIKRASADVGFIFVAYNLRRIMNTIDKNVFKKFLRELGSLFCQFFSSVKAFAFNMGFVIFTTITKKSFLQVALYRF